MYLQKIALRLTLRFRLTIRLVVTLVLLPDLAVSLSYSFRFLLFHLFNKSCVFLNWICSNSKVRWLIRDWLSATDVTDFLFPHLSLSCESARIRFRLEECIFNKRNNFWRAEVWDGLYFEVSRAYAIGLPLYSTAQPPLLLLLTLSLVSGTNLLLDRNIVKILCNCLLRT